jgi:plasmid maintenance system antidote protein VapI
MDAPSEALRNALGDRSQGWLAKQIGIKHPTSVCLILAGRRRLTPQMARRMALALELDTEKAADIERQAALAYIKV